jgi:hypothetical protein
MLSNLTSEDDCLQRKHVENWFMSQYASSKLLYNYWLNVFVVMYWLAYKTMNLTTEYFTTT